MDKDPGPCRNNMSRFFYNYRTRVCEPFSYGGCRGNANNFGSASDCQQKCSDASTVTRGNKGGHSSDDSNDDGCLEGPEPGQCGDIIERFFFDARSQGGDSIDILGTSPHKPKPLPNHVWRFETCPNLLVPSY